MRERKEEAAEEEEESPGQERTRAEGRVLETDYAAGGGHACCSEAATFNSNGNGVPLEASEEGTHTHKVVGLWQHL